VDSEALKGPFKSFGLGSALEHQHSSVYYDDNVVYDTSFSIYNWIGAHEYFHTLTPLSLHSEKIAHFNFREPDMSRHVWMYEGMTDYLAMLLSAQSPRLPSSPPQDIASATQYALDRSRQRMTESGRNILSKGNPISWFRKIKDLGNFYAKGKLIAFALDLELLERSQGKRRLLDVLQEMRSDFEGAFFDDTELLSVLERYTYPGFREQFSPWIEGKEMPPYQSYFDKLGWVFYPKKTPLPTYGRFFFLRDRSSDRYYVGYAKDNELGLVDGDTVLAINQVSPKEFMQTKRAYYDGILYPGPDDQLEVEVLRSGETIRLSGTPQLKKIQQARMKVRADRTEAQQAFSDLFYDR